MPLREQSLIRRQQVEDFRASGQTLATWCLKNNLNINTLRYWLTKCSRETNADSKQATFIELKHTPAKEVPIIVKMGTISLELYSGFSAETLREVIAAIRSL